MDKEVYDAKTGEYVKVSERYDLSQDEWETYQMTAGQAAYEMQTRLTHSEAYQSLSSDLQAKAIKLVYKYTDEHGKAEAVSAYSIDESWILKADKLSNSGISVEDFIVQYVLASEDTGNYVRDTLSLNWLDDDDKALLIATDYSSRYLHATFTDPYVSGSGFEFTLTDAQYKKFTAEFDKKFTAEFDTLVSGTRYKRASLEEREEMVKDLQSKVAKDTKKWMALQLRSDGIPSTREKK